MDGVNPVTAEFGSLKNVIKQLGVSRSLVYSLEKKRLVNFYRLGGKIFLKWNEIKRALQDSCKGCK
jgi:predicted DNA-binding transcriptional regulator AlpA